MIIPFLCLAISLGERLPIVDHSVLESAPSSYLEELHSTGSTVADAAVKKHHLHEHSVGFPPRTTMDNSFSAEPTGPAVLLQPEDLPDDLTCSDGVLDLPRGRYQIDPSKWKGEFVRYLHLKGCKNLTVHGTTLELFAPLVFDSRDLEFQGHLAIVAKSGMTCLTVYGSFVVSGDLSIEGCVSGSPTKLSSERMLNDLDDVMEKRRRFFEHDASDEDNEVDDDEWEDGDSLLEIPEDPREYFSWYFAGGAFYGLQLTHRSGTLSIQNCRRHKSAGGALRAEVDFSQLGGALVIQNCTAVHGGAIKTGNFSQLDGKLLIKNCNARDKGGAIQAKYFLQLDGDMMIRNCSAGLGGAAVDAGTLEQENGNLSVEDCVALEGGAIKTDRFHLRGRGVLRIERCKAMGQGGGGGIFARRFLQSSGLVSIHNCSATFGGGGIIALHDFQQWGGRMMIQNCTAFEGGGIFSRGLVRQDGDLGLHSCSAENAGGAIYLERGLLQSETGRAIFENCSAREGGGLHRPYFYELSFQGQVVFTNCSALDGRGGGVYARGVAGYGKGRVTASEFIFQGCTARTEGAAVYSESFTTLGNVTLNRCESGVSGALTVYGDLNVSNLKVNDAQDLKGQSILSSAAARVHSLICSGTGQQLCGVGAAKGSAVGDLVCPTGTERRQESGNGTVWCHSCVSGHVRLVDSINPQCQPCPKQSIDCLPDRLKMPPGMTVDPSNFSIELYCPNPAACRGGSLLAPRSRTNLSVEDVYRVMCEEGYVGTDCSKCSESHGKADHNPLICVKCPASSTSAAMRSIFFYTARDCFLFASAAASSLAASKDKKRSAIFLNQLMAFATVANIVATGVMQTRLFAEFHADTRRILTSAGLLANVAQAQGDGTASKDCLLNNFGFPGTLIHSHLVSTAMPVILMTLLAAWKGPKLSLVLGTNVFLPGFTAAFGKYLIAFRSKPQHEGGILEMPFMPSMPGGEILIPLAILFCFAVGILGWGHAIHGAEKPFPPYVLYLTGSYKPECRGWEIERLVRKMLLSVLTCAIPVSYSPALQMEAVSLVLIASMNLHTYYMPYKVNTWNFVEIGLLTVALILTGLTTTLVATDLHFSQSRSMARVLIFLVILLVAVICGTMIVLVLWNIYWEWKSKGEAAEAEAPDPQSEDRDGKDE